jgi:hypothetical protein
LPSGIALRIDDPPPHKGAPAKGQGALVKHAVMVLFRKVSDELSDIDAPKH